MSARPPGCHVNVACYCKGIQVSSTTHLVHVLLRLDVDERILCYNTIKVCVGRFGEPMSLKVYVTMLVYHDYVFSVTETFFQSSLMPGKST